MDTQSQCAALSTVRSALAAAGAGSPAVTVGIIDGLPELGHPVLQDALIDVVAPMIPPDHGEADPHATSICSLIFGQKDPVRGLAPACSGLILPVFFRRKSEGTRPVSQLDLARAISFALERNVDIINISAGQKSVTTETESHLAKAIEGARERGVLLVAAAGNDGCDCIHIPAAAETVLSVGALGADGRPLETSNWAEPYRRNGLLAPGADLPVAVLEGRIATGSGTSFATAIVSAVAAILLSVARRERRRLEPADIRDILIETATPCTLSGDGACDRYLAGTLDAAAAFAAVERVGTVRYAFAPLPNAGASPPTRMALSQQQSTITGMGSSVMSISNPIEPNLVEQSQVSPSACSCQTKPEEEPKASVQPQSASAAAAIASSATATAPDIAPSSGLNQLACSCGGGEPPQIVFALGALWFDFGTEARYDAIVQQLGDPVRANTPSELFGFLRHNPHFLPGITFILMQEQIPLYAIHPAGPFALQTYNAILDALDSSLDANQNREQRVSIPGVISGTTRLLNGMTVPIVYPDLRGMYKWQSRELIAAAKAAVGKGVASDDDIFNFLNRVYYELRNLGVAPQERAINFAATNAYQTQVAFAESAGRNLALDTITVVKSPICRPDSDCWDVQLQMFDPENERRASRVYRYTVDVSEVLPVTVGTVRTWAIRTGSL